MPYEQKFQVTMIMIPFLLWFGWYAIHEIVGKETKNQAVNIFAMATLCIMVMLIWFIF